MDGSFGDKTKCAYGYGTDPAVEPTPSSLKKNNVKGDNFQSVNNKLTALGL